MSDHDDSHPVLPHSVTESTVQTPEKLARQRHQEMISQHQEQYLEMLHVYRDIAASHPGLIPELRRALKASMVLSLPHNPKLLEDVDFLREDIDALLQAMETGEVDSNR